MSLQLSLLCENGNFGDMIGVYLDVRDKDGSLVNPEGEISVEMYSTDADDGDALTLRQVAYTSNQSGYPARTGKFFAPFDTSLLSTPTLYPSKVLVKASVPEGSGVVTIKATVLLYDPESTENNP